MQYPPTIHQKEQQTLQHEKRLRTTFIPTCYWRGIFGLFVDIRETNRQRQQLTREKTLECFE